MDEEKLLEQFIANLKTGLTAVESGGNYQAQNPDSSAAGKYQFTKAWLPKIRAYAKKQGIFDDVNNMDDFKSQPELQEGFFNHYAKTELFKPALALSKSRKTNPLGLSLDEIGATMHFQGVGGGRKAVTTGKLPKSTGGDNRNVSGERYLEVFNKGLKRAGQKKISMSTSLDPKEKQAIYDQYNKQNEKIDNADIDDQSKERLRDKLHYELRERGDLEVINEMNTAENDNIKADYNLQRSGVRALSDVLKKAEIRTDAKGKVIGVISKTDATTVKFVKEMYPEMFKNEQKNIYGKGGRKLVANEISFSGNEAGIFYNNVVKKGVEVMGEDFKGELEPTIANEIGNKLNSLMPESIRTGYTSFTDESDYTKAIAPGKLKNIINPDTIAYRPKRREVITGSGKTTSSTQANGGKSTTDDFQREQPRPLEQTEAGTADAEDYFGTLLGSAPMADQFAYGETKGGFNMDIVSGLVLGIKGMNDAKGKIPLRTEQVSNAFRNFTADLKKKSREGLPVELEAAMINNLNEAYHGGIENLVRASAGNRNLVLGNQGQLELAKNKGIMEIARMDFEAKERAMQQYGEALKHIDSVDHNREIANHGIRYQEAIKKRGDAEALAAAGFGQMIEGIRYQKENGPGSANDMMRSHLMQNMFGYDPKMKDDGTGTKRGTKSFFDKNKALLQEDIQATKDMHKRYNSLSPDQKKAFSGLVRNTHDKKHLNGFMDYMQQNEDADLSNMDYNNLDLVGKSDGDYSMLTKKREDIPLVDGKPAEFVSGAGIDTAPQPTTPEAPQVEDMGIAQSPAQRQQQNVQVQQKQQEQTPSTNPNGDMGIVGLPNLEDTARASAVSPGQEQFEVENPFLITK